MRVSNQKGDKMKLRIGTTLKTKLGEKIIITGNRSIRSRYFYLFKDEHNLRGFISRDNLIKQVELGELNIVS